MFPELYLKWHIFPGMFIFRFIERAETDVSWCMYTCLSLKSRCYLTLNVFCMFTSQYERCWQVWSSAFIQYVFVNIAINQRKILYY